VSHSYAVHFSTVIPNSHSAIVPGRRLQPHRTCTTGFICSFLARTLTIMLVNSALYYFGFNSPSCRTFVWRRCLFPPKCMTLSRNLANYSPCHIQYDSPNWLQSQRILVGKWILSLWIMRCVLFSIRDEVLCDPDFCVQTVEHDRQRLLAVERLILETICFNFTSKMPFPYVIKIGRTFKGKPILRLGVSLVKQTVVIARSCH